MKENKLNKIKKVYISFYFPIVKIIGKLMSLTLITIVVFSFAIFISNNTDLIGYKVFSISSNSMQPNIKKGDLIIVDTNSKISNNDIITYKPTSTSSEFVTHRIKEFLPNNKIQTKGDNNSIADPYQIEPKNIEGKVISKISHLGLLVLFIRSLKGMIILIIIPATVIITLNIKELTDSLAQDYRVHKLY